MKKRILSFLVMALMLLSLLPSAVFAADAEDQGPAVIKVYTTKDSDKENAELVDTVETKVGVQIIEILEEKFTKPVITGYEWDSKYWLLNMSREFGAKDTIADRDGRGEVEVLLNYTPNTYTVTFDANEGTVDVESKDVIYGDIYGDLPTPTRTGYEFAGWYLDEQHGGTIVYDGTPVATADDHTLVAHWNEIQYRVRYRDGDAYGLSSYAPYTGSITLAEEGDTAVAKIVKTGYHISGWRSKTNQVFEPGATVYVATLLENDKPDDDDDIISLYPVWEPNTYTVTLTGDFKGIDVGENQLTATYDAELDLPDMSKEGYTFNGWCYLEGDSIVKYEDGAKYEFTDDLTLEARWTPHSYWVSLSDGENTVAYMNEATNSRDFEYGKTYDLPEDAGEFEKTGYHFDGWYDNKDCEGTAVTSFKNLRSDNNRDVPTVYYAKWTPNQYTITFADGVDDEEITVPSDITATYDEAVSLATVENAVPVRTGYEFAGWTDGSETYKGDAELLNLTAEDDAEVTLTAQWDVISYDIIWVVDDKEVATATFDYGTNAKDEVNDPNVIDGVKPGYTFWKWDRDIPTSMPAEDVIITALWHEHTEDGKEVISADPNGYNGEGAANLFDGKISTKFCDLVPEDGVVTIVWSEINHKNPAIYYRFMTADDTADYPGRNPDSWVLYGSDDPDDHWVVLDEVKNDTVLEAKNYGRYTFKIDNPKVCTYYKLVMTGFDAEEVQLAEVMLHYTEQEESVHTCVADVDAGYEKDETGHWYKCTDKNCDEKVEFAAHDIKWTVDGTVKSGVCTVCGYEPANEHVHVAADGWFYDGKEHWHACVDNADPNHAKLNPENHVINTSRVGNDKFMTNKCTVCGYTYPTELTATEKAKDNLNSAMKYLSTKKYDVILDTDEGAVVADKTSKNFVLATVEGGAAYRYLADVKYAVEAADGYEIVAVYLDGKQIYNFDGTVIIKQIKNDHVITVVTEAVDAAE